MVLTPAGDLLPRVSPIKCDGSKIIDVLECSAKTGNSNNTVWLVVWKIFYFSISYMGCHPNPSDFHSIIFSRWLLHHQPAWCYVKYVKNTPKVQHWHVCSFDKMFEILVPTCRDPHFGRHGWLARIPGWWFGTGFFFHSVGNFIIPTDFHIFSEG